jgi:tetratricopeptide (TPR) repeat protein
MRQFGPFLANLRSSARLSLEELGMLVDTSRTTISRLENNEVPYPFKGQTRKVVLSLAEILCTSSTETERYLKLADIDRSLLTEVEEIQLGFAPRIAKNSPAEVSDLTRLEHIYTQLLHNLETRQAVLGNGKAPPHLAVKIQEYTQALHDIQQRLDRISQKQTQLQQEAAQEKQPESTTAAEGRPVVGYPVEGSFVSLENGVLVPVSHFLSTISTEEAAVDAETWFSEKTARIFAETNCWKGQALLCKDLQRLLELEMDMFNEVQLQYDLEEFHLSRRNALKTIAAIPAGLLAAVQQRQKTVSPEEFLPACTASLSACWHLMNGKEIIAVEQAVSKYLPILLIWARQSSPYQKTIAYLASQGCLLLSLVSLHQLRIQSRVAYCKQAVEHAKEAGDCSLLVRTLVHLGDAFHTDGQLTTMLLTYQEAVLHADKVSLRLRSHVLAEASRAYAQHGQEQEALRCIGEARAIFPGEVGDASGFLLADTGLFALMLFDSQTRLDLGKQYEDAHDLAQAQTHYKEADNALAQIEALSATVMIPDRILLEIINQQALTAIKVNNLENFEKYFIRGIQGANILGSQKRRQEAIANWKEARKVWPDELRVLQLADLFF